MIIRTVHNRENPYVMVNKSIVNDSRLSLKALGLWLKCMSKPDNWKFHVTALVKELKEGKTAVYSALEELIEAGYCIRGQRRAIEGGRFEAVEYVMYEFPVTDEDKAVLEKYFKNSLPRSGFPQPEKPHTENPTLTSNDSHKSNIDKEHICPEGLDAPSLRDEFGHSKHNPIIRGEAKEQYNSLNAEQKAALQLIMNVPPAHDEDQRFNVVTAMNILRFKRIDEIRKAIMVYKQRLERGERPRSMGGYLKEIIEKGYEPAPAHAEDNKRFWADNRMRFPKGSYEEHRDYVSFPRVDKELTWVMSSDIFSDQLNRILNTLRDS